MKMNQRISCIKSRKYNIDNEIEKLKHQITLDCNDNIYAKQLL